MLQQNGAIQGNGGRPGHVTGPAPWVRSPTPSMAGVDADRTTSELNGYASKLNFVRGLNFKYSRNHDGGPIAASTGAPVTGQRHQAAADQRVDRLLHRQQDGRGPGAAHPVRGPQGDLPGRRSVVLARAASLRIGRQQPLERLPAVVRAARASCDDRSGPVPEDRRASDVGQRPGPDRPAADLLRRTDLSKIDRERLDLHLTSVRDMEVNMGGTLGPMAAAWLDTRRHDGGQRQPHHRRQHGEGRAHAARPDRLRLRVRSGPHRHLAGGRLQRPHAIHDQRRAGARRSTSSRTGS